MKAFKRELDVKMEDWKQVEIEKHAERMRKYEEERSRK